MGLRACIQAAVPERPRPRWTGHVLIGKSAAGGNAGQPDGLAERSDPPSSMDLVLAQTVHEVSIA